MERRETMYNKVILVGNLTRDIELKYSQGGTAIANTAIATSHKYTSNGEKKEEVCFIDISFFGRSAEIANRYLHKGSKVLVEGRLQFQQWEKDGQKHSKHSVLVETMQMLDSKPTQEKQEPIYEYQNAQGQTYQPQPQYQPPMQQMPQQQPHTAYREPQRQPQQQMPQPPQGLDFEEDEIPF